MKATLTDRALEALKPAPEHKRYTVWDAVVPNFGVRVTDKGHRSFIVRRRRAGDRRPIRFKIGDYPTITLKKARELGRAALEHLATGTDPRVVEQQRRRDEARKRQNTLASVVEDFVARHAAKRADGASDIPRIILSDAQSRCLRQHRRNLEQGARRGSAWRMRYDTRAAVRLAIIQDGPKAHAELNGAS